MIKNYINKTRLGLLKTGVFGMFLAVSGWASAQISGTVTLGTGGTYSDWAGLASAISGSGVNGKLTVNVISDVTTSATVTFTQNATYPTSSTKEIVINGNGYKLSSSATYAAIVLNGMDYMTIDNVVIQKTANSTTSWGVQFMGQADYNKLTNNTIEFTALTSGTTSGTSYVVFSASTSSISSSTSTYNGRYNLIEKNLMRTQSGSPGPAYAISNVGSTSVYSSTASNNTFNKNTIENFYYMAVYNYYTNGDQFTNNDISRANATSNNAYSVFYGFYNYYTYSTNRSTLIDGNYIHDLPFKGSTSANGYSSTVYGMYNYYNYGNATNYFTISNNKWENISCLSSNYFAYSYYNYYAKYDANTILKWNSYGTSAYCYGYYMYYQYNDHYFTNNVIRQCSTAYYTYFIYSYYGDKKIFNNNTISNNTVGIGGSYGYGYIVYAYYPSSSYTNEFNDNKIDSNTFGYYTYLTYMYYWNGTMNRNRMTYNSINSSAGGYIYALNSNYFFNQQMNNNLIANNTGYYGLMGLYAYSYNSGTYYAECKQNTLYVDATNAGYAYHYTYGLYFYPYYHSTIDVTGNLIDIQNSYGAYPAYTYNMNGQSAYKRWDYNNYYLKNISYQYWYCPNGSANDLSGWNNIGFAGPNETGHMPVYVDQKKNDFRVDVFELQNRVPQFASTWPTTPATNANDHVKAKRNPVKSDHGAFEHYMNIQATKSDFTVPATVCAGFTTASANIYVKNKFVDTIYGFNVALEAYNGTVKTVQKVTTKILPGNEAEVKIAVPITLSTAGKTQIKIYVDAADDNLNDDTLYFNTEVLPAPGGANFRNPSAKSTAAVYQLGKANDVTIVGEPVIYDVPAPRKYSNSTYGTSSGDWQAFVSAKTQGGRTVTGATLTPPTSGKDMEVKFVTSDASLEDTMITLTLRVLDNNNGCDTFIKRNVFIYPSITPLFSVPTQICEGNAVLFENKSKVLSGSMEFKWNFGTGNAADTTDAPEPVFQFPGNGTYKVKLTAKTVPFGFAFDTTIDVTVNPIPTIAFTKSNACEGESLTFTNKTTPAAAKSTWDFGDGTTSTAANPTKKYAKAGQYTVVLKADLNGCVGTMTQKVYQFTRPKADFDKVVGSCDNDEFEFMNKTTVTAGLFGNNWNFDDNGNVSTDLNPTHDFQTSGTKNVKLVVTSEFGCKDSIVKAVVVKPSPKASFVNGPLCSVKPTDFTNTTPDVSGTVANYAWSFGDGSTSGAKSPTKDWFGNLGPKKVTLKVTLDNGCTESVSKDLVVLTQPKPNFTAEDVCAGDDVIFVNNTTWAQGDITYRWNFGDGTESTNSDPTKKYNTSVTLTPFVTLYAYIQGGCGDSITKNITINETPRTCDFVAEVDYASGFYGMKFEPINNSGVKGGQANVDYIWVFEGGGTVKKSGTNAVVSNNFATDGTYKVTMRAMMSQTKCECSISKTVEMNRSSAESLMTSGVAVYPNPNNGQFTVATTEAFGKNVTVEVMSLSGAVVKRMSNQLGGMISVDASEVSNGMYLVKVMSGDKVVSTKINIQH